jgi:hypothetical protein
MPKSGCNACGTRKGKAARPVIAAPTWTYGLDVPYMQHLKDREIRDKFCSTCKRAVKRKHLLTETRPHSPQFPRKREIPICEPCEDLIKYRSARISCMNSGRVWDSNTASKDQPTWEDLCFKRQRGRVQMNGSSTR